MCKCKNNYRDDKLHHECGVFGIYGVEDAAGLAYYGLHALQHRGQQGCGIVTVDADGDYTCQHNKFSMAQGLRYR